MKQSYSLSVIIRLLAIGISSIGTLYLLPLILNNLGEYQFGIWGMVSSITGYLLLLDFGIALACTRYLSIYNKKREEWFTIISNSLALALAVSLSLFIVLAISWLITDTDQLTKKDQIIFYVSSIVLIEVILSIPLRIYTSILRTEVLYFNIGLYEIIRVITRIAGVSTTLLLGYGLIEAVLIATFANLLFFLLPVLSVLKRHNTLFFKLDLINTQQCFELLQFSKFTALSQSAEFLKFRTDSLVVAILIGVSASAHYTIIVFIVVMLTQVLMRFMSYWDTIIISSIGESNYPLAKDTVIKSLKIGFAISIISIIGITFIGSTFISMWVGENYTFLNNSLILLSFILFSISIQMATTPYFNALKQEKLNASIDLIELVIKFIIIYPLTILYHLNGLIIASLVASLLFGASARLLYFYKFSQGNVSSCNGTNTPSQKATLT